MKIFISGIPEPLNYGSAMMAINLIAQLTRSMPRAKFFVDSSSDAALQRLQRSLPGTKIFRSDAEEKLFRAASSRVMKGLSYVARMHSYCDEVTSCYDAVLFIGGDDLSEGYSKFNPLITLTKIRLLAARIPVMLVGQTIGPFTSVRKLASPRLLRKSWTYARDPVTYDYMTRILGLDNVTCSSDLAFIDLPRQNGGGYHELKDRLGLPDTEYVTVVPSGYVRMYSSDANAYAVTWVRTIQTLLATPELADRSIVLLPHVLKAGVDDRDMIRRVVGMLPPSTKDRICSIDKEMLPHEARIVLGKGDFTVTGRMHAAVSTFQMGRPAISLSYSPKYKGVISQGLSLPELVVECTNKAEWQSGAIADRVQSAVQYVIMHREELEPRIVDAVAKAKKDVESMIADICRRLSSV